MRKAFALLPILMILIVAQAQNPVGAEVKTGPEGQGPAGIAIKISMKQDAFKIGSEIKLTVLLTNTTNHDVFLLMRKEDPSDFIYTVEVLNDHGDEARQTTFGGIRRGKYVSRDPETHKPMVISTSQGPEVKVQPGKTLSHEVDISKLYNFDHPGKYVIQVTKPDTSSAKNNAEAKSWPIAKSNVIKITVE